MNRNCYYCQLCINSLAYSSFDSLYLHINAVHGKSPSFKLRCELTPLCGSIYRTFASYRTHIYKYHRKLISKSNDKEDVPSCSHHASNNELGVAKRHGISFFQLVEHISPQRQEKSL